MPTTIKTTVRQLIGAYGSKPIAHIPGLSYSNFGRSGLASPTYGTIFGIEFSANYYWLDTGAGRKPVYENEQILIND